MSQTLTAAEEFRDTAMRMVAATEYFKSEGELPSWARAELASWDEPTPLGDVCAARLLSGCV